MSSRSSQYVEVQLEIGHKATPKTKLAADGHTHDWTVFVRGPENSNIQHFVEKVVFHLHDSFPKPKRVLKEPPYQVSESGYASFELPVEVYFKNKEEPKKISFDYDLYLRLDDAVSHSRREKLTFQNPSNDFKKKLLKAGGITNESNASSVKTGVLSDEKTVAQIQQTPTSNIAKPLKPNVSGSESKKSKTLGVIPSKDKSLNNSQNSSNVSSTQSVVCEKPPIISSSNNKQFTDLFGTPIQARPPSESKNKESCVKSKFTAIASKGVKNDSKSLHKNSTKKSYSSPSHKNIENKSSKDTKESKVSKDSKVSTKTKDSTKGKREDQPIVNKSKKKNQSQQPSQLSPKTNDVDKKADFKASKKRRNSTSSTSSSLTASSFSGSTESKPHKEEPKGGSLKEKDNKKESKKQKISSKDMNTASGVKKQSSTSTKISFSDNNSSTTIEIKSVKKEKTWDNEVKKSRSKESKSSEFKAKDKSNVNSTSATNANKTKTKADANCLKSGKVEANKNLKVSAEKQSSRPRKRSTSHSSESRLTPGLSSPPSTTAVNYLPTLDIESHESLSPLSSDNTSVSSFKPIRNNNETNNRFISDDSDSDSVKDLVQKNNISKKKDSEHNSKNKAQNSISQTNKRKRETPKESIKRLEPKSDVTISSGPDFKDSLHSNELMEIQKKINESTNSDVLQIIVDVIEESGLFCLTKTSFDFDLMRLDDNTIKKLKTYLY